MKYTYDAQSQTEEYSELNEIDIAENQKIQRWNDELRQKIDEQFNARKAILDKLGLTEEEVKLLLS